MNTNPLYDSRVSAACLALREDPPAALDGPILQYARDALAAAEVLRNTDPMVWRRRTFAAIVAFIGVVSVTSLWESASAPAPQAVAPAPVLEPIAPITPAVVDPPTTARVEATPTVTAKPKPATVAKKKRASAPPPAASVTSTAIPDEPVQVKTIAVEDDLAPTPIAPPSPLPAIEAADPVSDPCVADPQAAGCVPPL